MNENLTFKELERQLQEKAASRKVGYVNPEDKRLRKEIRDFQTAWFEKAISDFLDTDEGLAFIKAEQNQTVDDMFQAILEKTNMAKLYNKALKRKFAELRGVVH